MLPSPGSVAASEGSAEVRPHAGGDFPPALAAPHRGRSAGRCRVHTGQSRLGTAPARV